MLGDASRQRWSWRTWKSASFLPFPIPKEAGKQRPAVWLGDLDVLPPAGLRRRLSRGVGGAARRGSSGIKQLQKAAGVTGSERMQIVY